MSKIEELMKDAAAKEAIEAYAEEKAQGLKDKNGELLGEVKDLKGKLKKAGEAHTDLQSKLDDAQEQLQKGNKDSQAQIDAATKPLKRDLEKAMAAAQDAQGRLHKLMIQRDLGSALQKAKIAPAMQAAVRALIEQEHKVEVTDQDGQTSVVIDGKPAEAFVSAWAGTDTGKNFIAASGNGGGGAQGAGGGPRGNAGEKTLTRAEFDALPQADRTAKMAEGFKVVEAST